MRKKLLILAAVLLVLAVILAGTAHLYTEFLWFEHLGFKSVFTTVLYSQIGFGLVSGVVALIALLAHIGFIKKFSKPREVWTFPTSTGEMIDLKEVVQKVSTPVVILAAIVAASAMGYWASMHWEELLKLIHQTAFGQTEPILGKDIGFYLFTLPIMQFAQQWLVYLSGLCVVMSAVVYFLRNAIDTDGYLLKMTDQVRGHLLFGLAGVLVVIAWGWRIEMFETLFSKRGVAYGATYSDVYVNLVVYRVMIAACLVCALYLISLIFTKPQGLNSTKYPAIALGSVVALFLLGTFVAPTVVQQIVVAPNELNKEAPYLEYAIAGTRQAYGLDKIESKNFPADDKNLSYEDLTVKNRATVENIKIWDHGPLRATYKQQQELRTYYDFPTLNVDRYWVGGKYWQVMLSARELAFNQVDPESQTWVNRHLQYTHGYGVCLSPVERVKQPEGMPILWIKDIPPKSEFPNLKITQPEIYYGQATEEYVLVDTTTKELDYPKGDENIYSTYQGKGGVGIGTFFRRLLFTIRMSDINLFFTTYFTDKSKILFNRKIQDRVRAVAPFLVLDEEPYMTVVHGRQLWIQDAYTVSYRYPYSQPTALARRHNLNYIRNSVKVVIDAFHGSMDFFIWDTQDPMIRTYAKMFPELFKAKDLMSKELQSHVRYPKDLFMIQAVMYERFHMTDPQVWYNQEDKWAIPDALTLNTEAGQAKDANRMSPYYMIMKLPEQTKEEFLLMIPYRMQGKQNMVAWISGGCDGENYGKLLVYTFPKDKLIYGPSQIKARINQDVKISQDFTLWGSQGSQVVPGDLLVIPVEKSILYVQPIYLEATENKLPQLKKVIVAFGDRLAMEDNLQAAFMKVLRHEKAPDLKLPAQAIQITTGLESIKELAKQALSRYQGSQAKVAKGDWAGYGQEQEQLQKTLDQLIQRLEPQLQNKIAAPESTKDQPKTAAPTPPASPPVQP